MSKYCSENERVKRDYSFFLEAANGKQDATINGTPEPNSNPHSEGG